MGFITVFFYGHAIDDGKKADKSKPSPKTLTEEQMLFQNKRDEIFFFECRARINNVKAAMARKHLKDELASIHNDRNDRENVAFHVQQDEEIMYNECMLWDGDLPIDEYPALGTIPISVLYHFVELMRDEDEHIDLAKYFEEKAEIGVPTTLDNVIELREFLRNVKELFLEYFGKSTCVRCCYRNSMCDPCWLTE